MLYCSCPLDLVEKELVAVRPVFEMLDRRKLRPGEELPEYEERQNKQPEGLHYGLMYDRTMDRLEGLRYYWVKLQTDSVWAIATVVTFADMMQYFLNLFQSYHGECIRLIIYLHDCRQIMRLVPRDTNPTVGAEAFYNTNSRFIYHQGMRPRTEIE